MNEIYNFDKRKISPLQNNYTVLLVEDIPKDICTIPILFKSDEIEKFEVILLHRIMIKYYGSPSQLECILDKKIYKKYGYKEIVLSREEGENNWGLTFSADENIEMIEDIVNRKIIPLPQEWKYFIATESGEIIEIGSKDIHTKISINCLVVDDNDESKKKGIKESKRFISYLLNEANRLQGQLFNIKKEFEKGEGIQHYLLYNIYLSNYTSANMMLDTAEKMEETLITESLRYDMRTEDRMDSKKVSYSDKYLMAVGMYYASSIMYYFMAFEGFINLLYHAFLKHDFRVSDLKLEERLDLEMKLNMMPVLCHGFETNLIDYKSDLYKNFKRLKKYRNLLFHSKIPDSLKSASFVENSFLYEIGIDKIKDYLIPLQRTKLQKEDVLSVKEIVDMMIKEIFSIMRENNKILTSKYILMETFLPFWRLDNGEIRIGVQVETSEE